MSRPATADERGLPPSRVADDPEAIERVHAAVCGTESATTAAVGPEYPTVGDVATATSLSRLRALDALAVLVDSDTIRNVRRADGGVGFAPAANESSGCDTIKF